MTDTQKRLASDYQLSVPTDDPSFTITQTFKAPRELVWDCYTKPKHMTQFWGPYGSTTPVCEVDLKPGGVWRTVMRFESGDEYPYASVYVEIDPPERLVYRDAPYDRKGGLEGLPPVEFESTILLTEEGGRTRMTLTVRCPSIAFRDTQVQQGFGEMVKVGNERMTLYLEKLQGSDL